MADNATQPFHYAIEARKSAQQAIAMASWGADPSFTYTFENFFHPFVGELIEELNRTSVAGVLDPKFQSKLMRNTFPSFYSTLETQLIRIQTFPEDVDLREGGPYANYNWELLFHIPLTIAVHLSKNQRFAEAQRWFHLIFNPTTDEQSRRDIYTTSCTSDSSGTLQLCAVTADGGVWHTLRRPVGSWQPKFADITAVTSNPGRSISVACAADANDTVHVCVATADGGVWHTLRRPDGSWQPGFGDVKGQTSNNPGQVRAVACAADASNAVHVCVATADGGVWHTLRRPDGSWQPSFDDVKAKAGDPGKAASVACAADASNAVHVCVATADGLVWEAVRHTDASWRRFLRGGEVDGSWRFWKFLQFRQAGPVRHIEELLTLLSKPLDKCTDTERKLKSQVLAGYDGIRDAPFQPHTVARTRPLAYQYSVVMKYLDNLISWGDALFMQDTIESINEATQRYVLAANILGPRPEQLPARGTTRPKTFAQLKAAGMDAMGNALVELEGQFPFNLALPASPAEGGSPKASPLFGIGRSLYFCIPRNDKLLGYWDTVADRLFKIRHCMNIQGVVRELALFDPPLDPGMLVKAAAAGIDVGSIVSGLNQPLGPVRALPLIQKALEVCAEVRALGNALLAATEKRDDARLTLLRQRHEIAILKMSQDLRFLQHKQAEEATESLLRSRQTTLERYRYYLRMLGLTPDAQLVPATLTPDRRELTEENFDETFDALIGQFDKAIPQQDYPQLTRPGGSSPAAQSGAVGTGNLHLSIAEDTELNTHLRQARDTRRDASIAEVIATVLTFIPSFNIELAFWGLGGSSNLFSGARLSDAIKIGAEIARTNATWEQDQAGIAARTAGHERRVEEWTLQANLAARELTQIGRQVVSSLIAEQVARHEYQTVKTQIDHAKEVDRFLKEDKQAGEELYSWLQGELSRLYYEYYRFAIDTARRAERAMKRELMRPELETTDFVRFNYWDRGRDGLLSADALHLDLKRMEMAYHDNNRREYELTRHISLRQVDPLALLKLKVTGRCEVTIPEWFYDRECPGHYLRRIKSVALSLPAVVGPYTSVNCTLSLLRSSIRTSPLLRDDAYRRLSAEDDRFVDYFGSGDSIVTSGALNDTGRFEEDLRGERFQQFEGAGAVGTWRIELPQRFPSFDYSKISDLIMHIRYTARPGSAILASHATEELQEILSAANEAGMALLFSLPHDFPTEWSSFTHGTKDLSVPLRKDFFPYMVQTEDLTVDALDLYAPSDPQLTRRSLTIPSNTADDLNGDLGYFELTVAPDKDVLKRDAAEAYLLVRYSIQAS